MLNDWHSGAATGTWMLHQWQEDGTLRLWAVASLEYGPDIEKDEYIASVIQIREDGTAENVYENTLTEMDSTTWNAEYDKLMALLWNGIDPGEPAEWGLHE